VTVNAIAPGVFETDLNRELLKSGRGRSFLMRHADEALRHVDELAARRSSWRRMRRAS
jgi:NAD(P)-dependent dehydrogenase (short-subunit alcohol dehydrogenase family)